MIKRIGIICLALFVVFALLPRLTLAQSPPFLESRIARLESENFQLRSQLNRIESQLAQLTGQSTASRRETPSLPQKPSPNPSASQSRSRTNRSALSSDPMFERLATLVIELKERVQTLEAQVAQMKK
ncbi:MAG: hypothetical protein Fur006_04390 [Coleofasciculaceae cyanobacterium]